MRGKGIHQTGSETEETGFSTAGITAFHGRARFVDPTAVRVGDEVLKGRHVVVATGAMPFLAYTIL